MPKKSLKRLISIHNSHWACCQQFAQKYNAICQDYSRLRDRDLRGEQLYFGCDLIDSADAFVSALADLPADYIRSLHYLADDHYDYEHSIGFLWEQCGRSGMREESSVHKLMSAFTEVVLCALREAHHFTYRPMPRAGRKALLLRVAGLSYEIVDLPLAQHYFRAAEKWAKAAPTDEVRIQRLRHCADTFSRARTLFTAERKKSYKSLPPRLWYFEHALPLHVPREKKKNADWIQRFPQFMVALADLREENVPVYLEIMVDLYTGARAADGLCARTANFSDLCEHHSIIHGDEIHVRKAADYAQPLLLEWAYHELKDLAQGRTFVITDDEDKRDGIHKQSVEFVRTHLAGDNQQAIYLLRKIYVTALTFHFGSILDVRAAMNHGQVSTTERYFVPEFTRAMYELWLAGPRAAQRSVTLACSVPREAAPPA